LGGHEGVRGRRDCTARGSAAQSADPGVRERDEIARRELDLEPAAARRDEDRVVVERGLVDERRERPALAERADYVSVHTLLNAETRHLIGEAFFRRMKPTAILINTSRGPVVDEQALTRALQDKRLAGAALDVWETEPIGADNPLLKMDNVIATPHVANMTVETIETIARAAADNIRRVRAGLPPMHQVLRPSHAADES